MSQSHTHAPGEVHNHSHGPPEPQQQQQVTLQAPDPALQAIIEADFRPVDLTVGAPNDSFAYCPHSAEKCSECGLDFINLNRLSKLLTANPTLLCPPPPNVISQKLSTVITTTKEEGNVRVSIYSHLCQ
jgi:translocation protein SEC72